MIHPVCLHDKAQIEVFLRRDPALHLYEIGDLDDFFWQYTTWYGWRDGDSLRQLALIYSGTTLPVLLALSDKPDELTGLIEAMRPFLPAHMHAHLSGDAVQALVVDYDIQHLGLHHKMALLHPERLADVDVSTVQQLLPADTSDLLPFFEASYPGNWFDPRMLETGQYFGIRRDGCWLCVAGIHVYSPRYGVAALGNITTHPDFRGQGLGKAATAKLCLSLLEKVQYIGLNVKADNAAAIAAYRRIGFEVVGDYHEYDLRLKRLP